MKKLFVLNLFLLVIMSFDTFAQKQSNLFLEQKFREALNEKFNLRLKKYYRSGSNGDVVGNGAGLVELNFMYVYKNLSLFIQRYLSSSSFHLNIEDKEVMQEIIQVLKQKRDQKKTFEFVREQELNDLFGEKNRVAITGFSFEFPILINQDALYYDIDLQNNIPHIASVLLHELGHQAGVASHQYLDYLGISLKQYLELTYERYELVNNQLIIELLNRADDTYSKPNLRLIYKQKTKDLAWLLEQKIKCPHNGDLITYDIRNGHWKRPFENESKAQFIFWSKLVCRKKNTIRTFEKDFSLTIIMPELKLFLEETFWE